MSEALKMATELPQSLASLKREVNGGTFQRGPERYGLMADHFDNGSQYVTERSQGVVRSSNNIKLGKGILIVTRPSEEKSHKTVVEVGNEAKVEDYVTIQAAAVPNRPKGVIADLVIGNSVTLEEGVEVYNRNFHPMPGDEEEKRLFTSVGDNIVVGKHSIILLGSHVLTNVPPFSIVTLDKSGETKIIEDTNGLAKKYETIIKKLKSGEPAIKLVRIVPIGVTEYGTTFSIAGDEAKIFLGKCNFVPDGPLLVADEGGSITIGNNSGKTTFINRKSQLWALGYPITIKDGVQIAWNALITTSLEDKHGAITIGKNSWIGSNTIIYPGVTIGEGSIVAAGAIVTEDVPDYVLVAGRPATTKKKLAKASAMRGKEAKFD